MTPFLASTSTLPFWVVLGYLVLLLALGIFSSRFFRGTSKDYFVASRSIGSFMLLMSVFGTTMTGFALVGSSGKAFHTGVATYGAVAAWSGIIHSAIFFVVGLRLWAIGKRNGYVTQVQFFRDRFQLGAQEIYVDKRTMHALTSSQPFEQRESDMDTNPSNPSLCT